MRSLRISNFMLDFHHVVIENLCSFESANKSDNRIHSVAERARLIDIGLQSKSTFKE